MKREMKKLCRGRRNLKRDLFAWTASQNKRIPVAMRALTRAAVVVAGVWGVALL